MLAAASYSLNLKRSITKFQFELSLAQLSPSLFNYFFAADDFPSNKKEEEKQPFGDTINLIENISGW